MVRRAFLPAINAYAAELAQGVAAIKAACVGAETAQQEKLLHTLLAGVREIDDQLQKLDTMHHAARDIADEQKKANYYAHEIIPVMDDLRAAVDAMEILVDRDHWPVPTYNDLLFYV